MRVIYLIAICALLYVPVNAQAPFSLINDNSDRVVTKDGFAVAEILIKNNSNQTLNLWWKTLDDNLVQGWYSSVCDDITCHIGIPDSSDFMESEPGSTNSLKLNVSPMDISGTGTISFLIYDPLNPGYTDTAVFTITSTFGSSISQQDRDKINLKLYPVPAQNILNIDLSPSFANADITITNLQGQIILSETGGIPATKRSLNIETLPSGVYIFSAKSNDNQVYRTFIKD